MAISVGAYYHWSNRYARDGLLGLINKKAGAGVPYNKTPEDNIYSRYCCRLYDEKVLAIVQLYFTYDQKLFLLFYILIYMFQIYHLFF